MAKKFFSISSVATKPDCAKCGLDTVCRSPKLSFSGDGRLNTLIIDASPSLEEDTKGKLGYGKHYMFLDTTLEDMGYDLEKDFYYTTAIGCKTARNRKPTNAELDCCRARIFRLIEKLNPRAIILLGEVPFKMIIQPRITGRLTGTPYNDFYGDRIPDQEMLRWLCPTWGIGELLECKKYDDGGISKPYYQRDVAVYNQFKKHLQSAIELDRDVVKVDYESMCHTTRSVDQAIDWVIEAMDWEYVAWDIEASGKKLFRKGHFIHCMSISNGKVSYAFPNFDDPIFQKVWKRLLISDVKKIAHNLQYENMGTKIIMGYWVKSWYWDTMLSQHLILNNKPTGLKYCTYTDFGVIGYDDSADPYITKTDEDESILGDNCFNKIKDAPMEELLLYNAMDSIFTARLYEIHRTRYTEKQIPLNELYVNTAETLSKMSYNGFTVDESKFSESEAMLEDMLKEKERLIMESEEVRLWDSNEPFNFNSTKQLGHLLFDLMRMKPYAYTDKGAPSLDKTALEKMNHPFLSKILEYREIAKMRSTYIDGWRREITDGVIHSLFLLNTVDTGRSSSVAPNSQNQSKRDKWKKKVLRTPIVSRPDHRIIEYDFSGLETYQNMYYSKDPAYKRYLTEPDADMHKQFASKAFLLPESDITKEYRQTCKTQVFALAYGSYYKQIARPLWEYIQKTPELKKHISEQGIKTYEQYEAHAETIEKYYWTDMFGVHDKWRKQQWKDYQSQGYIETYTGFRCQAPMVRNATFNYPPQGSGAQCLYWVINHIQADIEKSGRDIRLIGEIHDSSIIDCAPEDEAWLDEHMWWYASKAIQEEWKWITVPLIMEKERSAIGGSWAEMYDCGELTGGYAEPKNTEERDK